MTGQRMFVAAALFLLAATPAAAKWEATEWNLTPEVVAAAMEGRAPLSKGKRGDRLGGKKVGNVGRHVLNGTRVRSVYYYDERGLAQISFEVEREQCEAIGANLVAGHGQPVRISDQVILRLLIWHDRKQGNRIRLLVSHGICSLNYERLSDYESIDLSPPPPRR